MLQIGQMCLSRWVVVKPDGCEGMLQDLDIGRQICSLDIHSCVQVKVV